MKKTSSGFIPSIRSIMMDLPGVTEDSCYGTTAFYVSKNLLARMKEDNKTLVVYTPDRDEWIVQDKLTFFTTDHYRNAPYVLVDLGRIKKKDLERVITEAWKNRAAKKLLETRK